MKLHRSQTLEAAISLALPLLIFYVLWFPLLPLVYLAGSVLLLALFSVPPVPWLLKKWMGLLHWVGILNTKIILALVFFLVLTPIAWIYRLSRKTAPKRDSTFSERNHTFSAADFERTF
jgi:hypothetical protein